MINKFLRRIDFSWLDVIFLLVLFCGAFLFFWNIDNYGLADWDEAWYAEIARNILKSHNWLLLSFNGLPYYDHPPTGFWLMAISMKIFGINEFAVRFPSALCGFLSIILIYLIGRKLFNRNAGFISTMILSSSLWFLYRARTGNLDAPLIFFLLLTFYSAIQLRYKSFWLPIFSISAAFLILTKSIVGVVCLLPSLIYLVIFWREIKLSIPPLLFAVCLFLATIYPWYSVSSLAYGHNFLARQLEIGTRNNLSASLQLTQLFNSRTLEYLSFGIGSKWFKLYLVSFLTIFFIKPQWKILTPIVLSSFVLLFGFLKNSTVEIWHLLPLYPLIALQVGICFSALFKKLRWGVLVIFFLLAIFQIKGFFYLLQLQAHGIADRSYVASLARSYKEPLYQEGSHLWPTVVFYSEKRVEKVGKFESLYPSSAKPFLLITERGILDHQSVPASEYKIIGERKGHLLLYFPKN